MRHRIAFCLLAAVLPAPPAFANGCNGVVVQPSQVLRGGSGQVVINENRGWAQAPARGH